VPLIAQIAAVLAALVHVWFFMLESVLFTRPNVWRRFGLGSDQEAAVVRPMAFNQGFYNLFLALGLGLAASGRPVEGEAIVLFACASMVGAAIVLRVTNRRFLQAALIQAVPPLVVIVVSFLG